MELIKSPLNYTGNKYRILPQLIPLFPQKIKVMVDMFCGGATVGLNIDCEEVYFIDSNKRIINLLEFLSKQKFEELLNSLEDKINYYGLSNSYRYGYSKYRNLCKDMSDNNGLKKYNEKGYYKLRAKYNSLTDKNNYEANVLLYLLMIYGFNNDIRFNKDGLFNLPIGKTDLNKSNVNKIKDYIDRCKNINAHFICASFEDECIKNVIEKADFIYMDPPYLITEAVYNMGWSKNEEIRLMKFIDYLISKKKCIALSNVLSKEGVVNSVLNDWCNNNRDIVRVNDINYHYRSSSYNKKNRKANEREVLIINR